MPKISQLPETNTVASGSYFPVANGDSTEKLSYGNLLLNIQQAIDVIPLSDFEALEAAVARIAGVVIQKTFADSPYTASWGEDIEVDCSGGAVTINLPTAIDSNGGTIFVTKIDSSGNNITVDAATTETINGSLTSSMSSQWTSLLYKSNGVNVGIR